MTNASRKSLFVLPMLLALLSSLQVASAAESITRAQPHDRTVVPTHEGPLWSAEEYPLVSMIALIANPERFDGRKITINGYIVRRTDEEDYLGVPLAVFTEEGSAMVPLHTNAVVVWACDPLDSDSPCPAWANEGYGLVSGRFSADADTPYRYSGVIDDVVRLELLPIWLLRDEGLRERQRQHVRP